MFGWHRYLGGRVHGESETQCVAKGVGLGRWVAEGGVRGRLERMNLWVSSLCLDHSNEINFRWLSSHESVGFDSGEGVSDHIVHTLYMTNGEGEL